MYYFIVILKHVMYVNGVSMDHSSTSSDTQDFCNIILNLIHSYVAGYIYVATYMHNYITAVAWLASIGTVSNIVSYIQIWFI